MPSKFTTAAPCFAPVLPAPPQASVPLHLGMPGREGILNYRLKTSVDAQWGHVSLVQAQLDGLAEVLRRCPNMQHVALASGHDVPVRLIGWVGV